MAKEIFEIKTNQTSQTATTIRTSGQLHHWIFNYVAELMGVEPETIDVKISSNLTAQSPQPPSA